MNRTPDSTQYDEIVKKHGDPMRVFAESAILRHIGELTGDSETRFREMNAVCYPNGADGIESIEAFAGITTAHVDWIRKHWATEHAANANLTPAGFARDNAHERFVAYVEELDEP